jgi:polysaccharide export outer membrane protein
VLKRIAASFGLILLAGAVSSSAAFAQSEAGFTPNVVPPGTLPTQGQPEPAPARGSVRTQTAAASGAATPAPANVEIGPGDLIDVRVFDTPELSSRLRVQSDGTINLPVGGKIHVAGDTAAQAAAAITQRFRDEQIMKDPHLDVFLMEYATQGVTVSGEVRSPGVYPLQGAHSVLDFLSAAGGLTGNASNEITIIPRDRNQPNYTLHLEENDRAGDLGLQVREAHTDVEPGDTIVVRRAGIVYVIGDVVRGGGYLIENTRRLSVSQALALAQGTNKTAADNKAKLIRTVDGKRVAEDVPLNRILQEKAPDPLLHDGDILFVPSSARKTWTYRGVEAAIQAAVGVLTFRTY